MKSLLPTAIALAVLAPLAAQAQSYTDQATVIDARPIKERIPIKREECWNEQVRTYEDRTVTRTDTGAPIGPGTVLGAIIGGVAGHRWAAGVATPRPRSPAPSPAAPSATRSTAATRRPA
jgi:uncharacterized protein YcfJ